MKKIFALTSPKHESQRLVESIKSDVRKYLKRERRKPLPTGVDFWDFDCKVGAGKNEPLVKHPAEVIDAISAVATEGNTEVYIEILAKPGKRTKKPTEPIAPGEDSLNSDDDETAEKC